MKTRVLVLAVALALVAGAAWTAVGDFINNAVAVTNVSQVVTIGTNTRPMRSVRVINDGANPVYYLRFYTGETVTAAAATDTGGFLVKAGESVELPSSTSRGGLVAITIVCGAGLTSTVRVWAVPW